MSDALVTGEISEQVVDALIVPVAKSDDGLQLSEAASAADAALNGQVRRIADRANFSGKAGSALVVHTLGMIPASMIVLAGVGSSTDLASNAISRGIGEAVQAARKQGAESALVALPDPTWGIAAPDAIEAAAIGAGLAQYTFERYRGSLTRKGKPDSPVVSVQYQSASGDEQESQNRLRRAEAIVHGVNLARDLGNEPGATLTPERMAAIAQEVAESSRLEIEVLGPEELAALGANAILAVGGGSTNTPRLVRLRYRPEQAAQGDRVVGLVGKSITFDTGGYSLKPYEGMLDMKGDMAGGAAVLGAMSALHALACPVPVEATLCIAENMVSGDAFRPGDVIEGMNGVTMEILSTDAEGRLVLADGLVDTARRGATELIDLATLTGAAVVALGDGTTALFANNDELAAKLLAASDATGERLWRMPLTPEFEAKIKGDVADIKNTGGRAGGAITAALFLQHFSEGLPWAHLDIAGANRQGKATELGPKGATGVGVRTLLDYLTA